MGRWGPLPPFPSCRGRDTLNHHRPGGSHLRPLSPMLVRLRWPLVATPRRGNAAASWSSGSRGHGGARGASRCRVAGRTEAAAVEPPPPRPPQPGSPCAVRTLRGTGAPGTLRLRAQWSENAAGSRGGRASCRAEGLAPLRQPPADLLLRVCHGVYGDTNSRPSERWLPPL